MAELVLSTVGRALGARLPGVLGSIASAFGQAGGALLGRAIDNRLFGGTGGESGRLTDLHLQTSTEGASIPAVFGRVRIAGQVIWAARFKEHADDSGGDGGKGGPRRASRTYRYTLSFAVGLCEGEIARIGRVWANGEEPDLSTLSWRLHRGGEDQPPDPLVEAVEGEGAAPAYRGLAYVVFEDLPLEAFGNAIPQLSFEVVRPAPSPDERFEQRVRSVCLIPGAGEFVYATAPVLRATGPGAQAAENVHAERGRANLPASLDQLAADFPNCETVLLAVAWFGDDLRCGQCAIRPGVEIAEKATTPLSWRAGGVDRAGARLISAFEGAPAFGGTPSDDSVLQAVAELKARGYKVGLYPLLLMDVPAGNGQPDPHGGAEQAAYPWRGRIALHPAPGQAGSPDKTAAAAAQLQAFFGAAAPAHFGASGGTPVYSGPAEWSYRRFVLHYAKLAALAGGVDAFILGSELRGVTAARDSATNFPAVAALQALAGDVRALLGPQTTLTYAADWSEYFGHQPQDGSGDVLFHLDALWADANIDAIGIDWYPPLTDWREGGAHLDAQAGAHGHDPSYLESRIEAGENYDWFYASPADRSAQARTPITDGAHGEPWIFRAKDLRNFWARAHYDRPGGVRAASPTAWTAQSKPIWLVELGCPAIDKGANAPNLFIDPKSAESALPPHSNGARDDLIQRRALDAYLRYWQANNPASSLTGAPMIETISLWCWDARPHPAFPARTDVWADGAAWRRGHWLNGRAGLSNLGETVDAICRRAGMEDADVAGLRGAVSGFVVDAPASAREALAPLIAAYDFVAAERAGRLAFFHPGQTEIAQIAYEDLGGDSAGDLFAQRGDAAETPIEARVRFIDASRGYLVASVGARRLDRAEGGVETVDAPLVLEPAAAGAIAQRVLADRRAAAEALAIDIAPGQLALEPGDLANFGGGLFAVERVVEAETRRIALRRAGARSGGALALADPAAPLPPPLAPTPAFAVLDLPLLPGAESDERPLLAVFAQPWFGPHELYAGADRRLRARAPQPARMGELLWPLWPGPVDRWDEGNRVRIRLYAGALASVTAEETLAGANAFAIEANGEWEIVQARNCQLAAPGEYELSGLLRGALGSGHAMRAPHPAGARIAALDARLARIDIGAHEWGEPLTMIAPPAGGGAGDARAAQASVAPIGAARRMWAPAHLRAARAANGDVAIAWTRCARFGGDNWGAGEPPLGAAAEAYRLDVLEGAILKRSVDLAAPAWTYEAAAQVADFGALPGWLSLRVAQIGDNGAPGLNSALTFAL